MATFKCSRCFLCLSEESDEALMRKEEMVKAFETSCQYLIDKDDVRKGVLQLFEDDQGKTEGLEVVLCGSCGEVAESVQELHVELEEIRRRLLGRVKVLQDIVVRNSRFYGTNGRAKKSLEELEEWVEAQEKLGRRSVEAEKRFLKLLDAFQSLVFEKQVEIDRLTFVTPAGTKSVSSAEDPTGEIKKSLQCFEAGGIKVELNPDDIPLEEEIDFNELLEDMVAEESDDNNGGSGSSEEWIPSNDSLTGKNNSGKKTSTNPTRMSLRQRATSSKISKSIVLATTKGPSATKVEHKCAHCDTKFTTASRLKVHLRRHKMDNRFRCETCDKTFPKSRQLRIHQAKEHDARVKLKCHLCPKEYAQRGGLIDHKKRVHGVGVLRTYECEKCHKHFTTSSSLCHHLLSHREEKKHICETCGYATNYLQVFKNHLKIHEGVLNFFCSHCPKAFCTQRQLYNHLRYHSDPGDKLECDLCPFVGVNRHAIYSHMKTVHGPPTMLAPDSEASNAKYECSTCHAKFTTKESYTNHRAVEHGEKPYVCKFCEATFSHRSSLRKHGNKHHKDKREEIKGEFQCGKCPEILPTKAGLLQHVRRCHAVAKRKRGRVLSGESLHRESVPL